MRGLILSAFLAIGAVSAVNPTPAAARDYQFCAQGRGVGIPGDCSYATYEQCQASASGRGLSCNVNPRAAFARGRGYNNDGYGQRDRGYRRQNRNEFGGDGFGSGF